MLINLFFMKTTSAHTHTLRPSQQKLSLTTILCASVSPPTPRHDTHLFTFARSLST